MTVARKSDESADAVKADEVLLDQRAPSVLFVIDSLGAGGSERSLAELLGPLARGGVQPVVVVFKRQPEGVERQVLDAGFEVRFLESGSRLARIRAVRRLVAEERPDVVHTTLFESDLAGRLGAAGRRIPVVTSLVNTSYDPVRFGDPNVRAMRLRMARLIDGWTARHLTSRFHAVSRPVKAAAVRDLRVPASRITVIERGRDSARLGVPSQHRRLEARRGLGLCDEDQVLLNLGRQEFQKGQRYLIEAMSELTRLRPRAVLLLAGRQGHASGELARMCRAAGLGDRVRMLGFVDAVPDLLAAADVFVFPSLYEGMPGALIEAMAAGLPVAASDIEGTREVLEPGANAILVPPSSSSELAAAVLRLLDEEDTRRAFGARSRSIFEQRFSLTSSVHRFLELYRGVLDGRGDGNREIGRSEGAGG